MHWRPEPGLEFSDLKTGASRDIGHHPADGAIGGTLLLHASNFGHQAAQSLPTADREPKADMERGREASVTSAGVPGHFSFKS